MIRLTLRAPTTIPLDLEGIIPERLAGLSAREVAWLPIWYGNRQEELGQFFEVSPATSPVQADLHVAGDTHNVKNIGAGMTGGFLFVENGAGMHAGARMTGGRLVIEGPAGDWLGAEMAGGRIEVRGDAGHLVGAAYRGARRGMSGGVIHVRGNAGDEAGLLMRRGLLIVEGRVGEFAAASLIAGTLVAGGGIGRAAGAGMKRGTVFVCGDEPEIGPGFRFSCEYRPVFLRVLEGYLKEITGQGFRGLSSVRCYRGDLTAGGHGELLVASRGG